MLEEISDIKTPEDILEFMNKYIQYGYLGVNGEEYINTLKNFRKLYRTFSIEDTLKHGIGTCVEQVNLMHYLLTKINIPSRMFCTRVYEGEDFNNLEAEEHMHCFILYFIDDRVFQIEHPNPDRIGIHEYTNIDDAIEIIKEYYEKKSEGVVRQLTEYKEIPLGLTFKELNCYINSLTEFKKEL